MVGPRTRSLDIMAETVSTRALTTLQRVKDRIYDTNTGASQPSSFDTILTRMINSCSEWFERECGGRRFVQETYINEIYSAYGPSQKRIVTRNAPVAFVTVSGAITQGSASITGVSTTAGLVVGMPILSDNYPVNTKISTIGSTSVTMDKDASSSDSTGYFQASGILNFQWRAGTPSNPGWIDFIIDQYELVNDGKAGVIRIYGVIPRLYNNMIRINYVAGYPVDWANAGNGTTHQLPADISETVENLVVRRFKRRMLADKTSEGLEGATTSWSRELDEVDKDVISHYRRMPTIF